MYTSEPCCIYKKRSALSPAAQAAHQPARAQGWAVCADSSRGVQSLSDRVCIVSCSAGSRQMSLWFWRETFTGASEGWYRTCLAACQLHHGHLKCRQQAYGMSTVHWAADSWLAAWSPAMQAMRGWCMHMDPQGPGKKYMNSVAGRQRLQVCRPHSCLRRRALTT